jgi:Glycosyl transferase family 2
MRLVMTVAVGDDADVLDAFLAFHAHVGVDLVLAVSRNQETETAEILDFYERDGFVRSVPGPDELTGYDLQSFLARAAATDHAADWVIPSAADEFWLPRSESLPLVLAAIPPRYTTVQALVRTFAPPETDNGFFAETMVVRDVVALSGEDRAQRLQRLLRPVFRADPNVVLGAEGVVSASRHVPLRAWYPIEMLRFPIRKAATSAPGVGSTPLVNDIRLRDALRALEVPTAQAASEPTTRFRPPGSSESALVLPVPSVVDDAAHAIECSEVGEVDLEFLERQVDALEQRIASLEARFWPRVFRRLSSVARRSSP